MAGRMPRTLRAGLALLVGAAAAAASGAAEPPPPGGAEQELFVTAPPRCRALPGDPLDEVDVSQASGQQQVIRADERGRFGVHPDDDPVTGPETWQRAGTAIRNYVFRAPLDGTPLCIGARSRFPEGFGQLRRVQAAGAAHGKFVRFTAFVATRQANSVRLWLAAGDGRAVRRGSDTQGVPVPANSGWTPVMLTMGPVPQEATKISYGFLLHGGGDVWLTEPSLEILDERPVGVRGSGVTVAIGPPEREQ